MKELEKAYEPQKYEDAVYKRWEDNGFFNPDVCVEKGVTGKKAEPFSIVLPPPNVTGTLHMGHAAMLAIEDVMVRYHRMKGDKTLWVPGTDHAAIATQSKVEKLVQEKEGKTKYDLGREEFLKRVRQFAQESHDTIVNQCKKMGASLDWSREAYTLDEQRSLAVRTVFKKMYDDGPIYRGHRVINWSVKGQSTCSDDELVYVERPAKLYYFKYDKAFPITIATTRPETKLGDTAVAVHPGDKRYKKFIGQTFVVDVGAEKPLNIKIIADEGIDSEFGTGALGVTPAHSAADFEMYQKQKTAGNDIGLIQVIGEDGRMTALAGKAYVGLTADAARKKFVQYLRDNKLLEKEEDIQQNVATSDRFGDIIEPLPKTQWFVDVNKKFQLKHSKLKGIQKGQKVSLKELMQQVVKSGQIQIIPERFKKTYFHWIDNLRDWCISRQIWFGHQIPVWYRNDEVYCDINPPKGEGWRQDPDTLDTWFSSGLWTFSTLGWPEKTNDLKTYHPTSVLETGYDILFFWVARMILMTTYTLGDIPFKTVYLHGLVRDEQGRKMSKTLGNVIDPLDMIKKYGTDATRLSLLIGNTPGNDIKLSEEKIAGFRNFTNKLWNISRFMLMNIENPKAGIKEPKPKTDSDAWILGSLRGNIFLANKMLAKWQIPHVGELLRSFTWDTLADWYLEIAKIEGGKSEVLNYILNTVLKLWHPYMPFATEAIWEKMYDSAALLMIEKYPDYPHPADNELQENVDFEKYIRDSIRKIRFLRADYKVVPGKKIEVRINAGDRASFLEKNKEVIKGLVRAETVIIEKKISQPKGFVGDVIHGIEVFIDLSGLIDVDKEKVRLEKQIAEVMKYRQGLEKKLQNKEFVNNAPKEVVESEKAKLRVNDIQLERLQNQLNYLK